MQRCQGHRGSGRCNKVYACASHGVLSGPALERVTDSYIKELALLNTIPVEMGAGCEKIKYLSVAPMFAEAIERIYQEIHREAVQLRNSVIHCMGLPVRAVPYAFF